MAVAFISHGYDTTTGNPYTETAWSDAHPPIGSSTYGVLGGSDWKVTAVAGQDRTVSIAAGFGWGHGVTDETAANETIQLDTIGSGSRWDLIAVRRDWTPTAGVTQFIKVNGGSSKAIPGGRLSGSGAIDDQPLALVQVTAGQTQPTAIVDLRSWARNGGMVAKDELVKGYLNDLGTEVFINGVEWRYVPGANDVPEWVTSGAVTTYAPTGAAGWAITGDITSEPAGTKRRITVDITAKRTGGAFTLDEDAWSSVAAVIPVAVQASVPTKYLPVLITGGSNHILAAATLNPAGSVTVRSTSGSYSFTTNAFFTINVSYYI